MESIKIFVYKNIDELIPYARNARIHSKSQIRNVASSIKEFGFMNPVIIDKNNCIIAGHCRVLAAEILNLKEIPCVQEEHLTETQKKAYILADNKLALDAEWDNELLALEIEDLQSDNFDIDFLDFDLEEIKSSFEDEDEIKEDEFNLEENIPDTPITQIGDIFMLGNNFLMCGDSTNIEDVKKLMQGKKCNLLLTDPPYNIAYEGKTKNHLNIKNDNLNEMDFKNFLTEAFKCADAVMENGAAFYIWHSESESLNFRMSCNDVNWLIRQCLIWSKNSFVLGRQDYQWQHEPCLYGWKEGTHKWYGDRKQSTILEFDKPLKNEEHPTMKPIPLFDYLIKNSSKKEDNVLDLFAGSGTTLIACEQDGRNSYNMELDPKYCDVIIKRWEDFTGKKAQKIN